MSAETTTASGVQSVSGSGDGVAAEAEIRHDVTDLHEHVTAPQPGLRCGRPQVVQHLIEADDGFTQRQRHTAFIVAMCGDELAEPTAPDDFFDEECPGCRDCFAYCRRCVDAATRFVEQPAEVFVGELRVPDLLLARCG